MKNLVKKTKFLFQLSTFMDLIFKRDLVDDSLYLIVSTINNSNDKIIRMLVIDINIDTDDVHFNLLIHTLVIYGFQIGWEITFVCPVLH